MSLYEEINIKKSITERNKNILYFYQGLQRALQYLHKFR